MPSPPDQISTIDQLRALPDDGHCHELLDGVHVVTAKQDRQHQSAIRGLLKTLGRQLAGRADYEVMISPSELVLGPRTFVQPDLFVVRQDPDHPIRSWADLTVPLLVVEVLSPDTLGRDRGVKRRIYQDAGVQEYWIVDLDQGQVERWRPARAEPEIACRMLRWTLPNAAAGQINLSEYFAEVLRED